MNPSNSGMSINPNDPKILRDNVFDNLDKILDRLRLLVNNVANQGVSDVQGMQNTADSYVTQHALTLFTRMKNVLSTSAAFEIVNIDDIPTMENRLAQTIAIARRELQRIEGTFEVQAQTLTADPELQKAYLARAAQMAEISQGFIRNLDMVLTAWHPFHEITGGIDNSSPQARLAWAQEHLPGYYAFLLKLQEYDTPIQQSLRAIGHQFVEHKRYVVNRKEHVFELLLGTDVYQDRTDLFEEVLKNGDARLVLTNPHYDCVWLLASATGDVEFLRVSFVYISRAFDHMDLFYPAVSGNYPDYSKFNASATTERVQIKNPQQLQEQLNKLVEQVGIGPIVSRRQGRSVEWQMKTANGTISLGTQSTDSNRGADKSSSSAASSANPPSNHEKFKAALQAGKQFHDKKDFSRAIKAYSAALKIDPNSLSTIELRGRAYLGKRVFRKALDDFSKLIEVAPNNASKAVGYYLRGLAYANMNNAFEAAQDFRRAIHANPNYLKAQESLAKLQSRRRR